MKRAPRGAFVIIENWLYYIRVRNCARRYKMNIPAWGIVAPPQSDLRNISGRFSIL